MQFNLSNRPFHAIQFNCSSQNGRSGQSNRSGGSGGSGGSGIVVTLGLRDGEPEGGVVVADPNHQFVAALNVGYDRRGWQEVE